MRILQSSPHTNNKWTPHLCEKEFIKISNFLCENIKIPYNFGYSSYPFGNLF